MAADWESFKARLAVIADVLQVVGFFGITAAVLWTAAVAAVGYFSGVPAFWIMVGASLAGLAVLACFMLFRRVAGTDTAKEEPANIKQWIGHDSYRLYAAACLWVGIAPKLQILTTSKAFPAISKLRAAIRSGQLATMDHSGDSARIPRDALLRYAESINEMPDFLK